MKPQGLCNHDVYHLQCPCRAGTRRQAQPICCSTQPAWWIAPFIAGPCVSGAGKSAGNAECERHNLEHVWLHCSCWGKAFEPIDASLACSKLLQTGVRHAPPTKLAFSAAETASKDAQGYVMRSAGLPPCCCSLQLTFLALQMPVDMHTCTIALLHLT